MAKILLVENDPLQGFLRKSVLERRFAEVERVSDAAEALCLVEQPHFAGDLGLVICGMHLPGFGGPAFVIELRARLPMLPVLVLGNGGEAAGDYAGEGIRFLPRPSGSEELLDLAGQMLAHGERQMA
jgi:DNA-binding NtrC family response regulator